MAANLWQDSHIVVAVVARSLWQIATAIHDAAVAAGSADIGVDVRRDDNIAPLPAVNIYIITFVMRNIDCE